MSQHSLNIMEKIIKHFAFVCVEAVFFHRKKNSTAVKQHSLLATTDIVFIYAVMIPLINSAQSSIAVAPVFHPPALVIIMPILFNCQFWSEDNII